MKIWLLSLAVLLARLDAPAAPADPREAVPRIEVGANVRVSPADAPHVEPYIAAHPEDPRSVVIAASELVPGKGTLARAYFSADGGRTWAAAHLPAMDPAALGERLRFAVDVWITYGADGTAYCSALANMKVGQDWRFPVLVYRSGDKGRTWQGPTVITGKSFDRPAIMAIGKGAAGHVYVTALASGKDPLVVAEPDRVDADGVAVLRSDDAGLSFRLVRFLAPDSLSHQPSNPVAMPDGALLVPYDDYAAKAQQRLKATRLYVVRLEEQATRAGLPAFVADVPRTSPGFFHAAVDTTGGKYHGRVYVAWNGGDMGPRRDTGTRRDVSVSYSADGGRSWSLPRILQSPNAGPAYFNATAVSKDGTLGLAWIQHEVAPGKLDCYRLYFAASVDGGETFIAPTLVSDAVSCPNGQRNEAAIFPVTGRAVSQEWPRGGDYIGLAADGEGIFHPVWVDGRDGVFAVYSARVRVVTP
ncbi:MAG TPA: sialidase family protein [Thermoanaerobaculia bacterium]|jgi:hypothetical protein|nr:sialidase family protein [Thermoanaerobaculia bacterium]